MSVEQHRSKRYVNGTKWFNQNSVRYSLPQNKSREPKGGVDI